MPLMVGNIVVLNSSSPPNDREGGAHSSKIVCQWIDAGGVLHEIELPPEMLSDDPNFRDENEDTVRGTD